MAKRKDDPYQLEVDMPRKLQSNRGQLTREEIASRKNGVAKVAQVYGDDELLKLEEIVRQNPDLSPDAVVAAWRGNLDPNGQALDVIRQQSGLPVKNVQPGSFAGRTAKGVVDDTGIDDWSDTAGVNVLKGRVRTLVNALALPGEMIVGGVDAILGEYYSSGMAGNPGQAGTDNKGFWDGWDDYAKSLSLVQQLSNWDSQGDGWFGVGDRAGEEQFDAKTRQFYRFELGEDGKQRKVPNSTGYETVNGLHDLTGALDPNSTSGKIVAGLLDLGVAVGTDPLMIVGGVSKAGKVKKAAELLAVGEDARAAAKAGESAKIIDDLLDAREEYDNVAGLVSETRKGLFENARNIPVDDEFKVRLGSLVDDAVDGKLDNNGFVESLRVLLDEQAAQRLTRLDDEIANGKSVVDEAKRQFAEKLKLLDEVDSETITKYNDNAQFFDNVAESVVDNVRARQNAAKVNAKLVDDVDKSGLGRLYRNAAKSVSAAKTAEFLTDRLKRASAMMKSLQRTRAMLNQDNDIEKIRLLDERVAELKVFVDDMPTFDTLKSIKENTKQFSKQLDEIEDEWVKPFQERYASEYTESQSLLREADSLASTDILEAAESASAAEKFAGTVNFRIDEELATDAFFRAKALSADELERVVRGGGWNDDSTDIYLARAVIKQNPELEPWIIYRRDLHKFPEETVSRIFDDPNLSFSVIDFSKLSPKLINKAYANFTNRFIDSGRSHMSPQELRELDKIIGSESASEKIHNDLIFQAIDTEDSNLLLLLSKFNRSSNNIKDIFEAVKTVDKFKDVSDQVLLNIADHFRTPKPILRQLADEGYLNAMKFLSSEQKTQIVLAASENIAKSERQVDDIKSVADEIADANSAIQNIPTDVADARMFDELAKRGVFATDELKRGVDESIAKFEEAQKLLSEKSTRYQKRMVLLETAKGLEDEAALAKSGDFGLLRQTVRNMHRKANGDFDADKVDNMMFGKRGQNTLQYLVDETSAKRIWSASRRKIPVTVANRLAKATSRDEVLKVLAEEAGIGVKGRIKSAGLSGQAWLYRHEKTTDTLFAKAFGVTLRPYMRAYEGTQALVPWAYRLNSEDVETVAPSVVDWMDFTLTRAAKRPKSLKPEFMDKKQKLLDDYFNRLANATTGLERRRISYDAMEATMKFIVDEVGGTDAFKEAYMRKVNLAFESVRKIDGESHYVDTSNGFVGSVLDDAWVDGPRGTSQLSNDIQLPNPKDIQKLVSRAKKFDNTSKHGREMMQDFLDVGVDKLFRTAVLVFRPAYILRNILEMSTRMWMKGDQPDPLTSLAIALRAGKDGGKGWRKLLSPFDAWNSDVFGRSFYDEADQFDDAGRQLQAQMWRERSAVDIGNAHSNMPGGKVARMVSSADTEFFPSWTKQLFVQRSDPMMVDIARVYYNRLDDSNLGRWLKKNRFMSDPETGLVQYYYRGPGRDALDELALQRPDTWGKAATDENLLRKVLLDDPKSILNNEVKVNLLDGQSPELLNVFFDPDVKRIQNIRSVARKVYKDRAEVAAKTGIDPFTFQVRSVSVDGVKVRSRRSPVQWFFDTSAVAENAANFGPEGRKAYWDAVEEWFVHADPEAQRKLLKAAPDALKGFDGKATKLLNKQSRQLNRLRKLADEGRSGELTLSEVHDLAATKAAKTVETLFYDAFKRKQYWYSARLAFPFGQAWSNTVAEWSKLAVQPEGYMRIVAAGHLYNEMSDSEIRKKDEVWNNLRAQSRPLFYMDPDTQQVVFQVPLIGNVIGSQDVAMPLSSLNVATGGGIPLPGAGPTITLPWKSLNNQAWFDEITPDWVDKWIDPFPSGIDKGVIRNTASAFMPSWANSVVTAVDTKFGEEDMAVLAPSVATYLLSTQGENYMNEAGVMDAEGIQRLADDVQWMSRKYSLYRGFLKASLPGSTIFKWQLEDADGDMVLQAAAQEDFQNILAGNNYDFVKSVTDFEQVYGPGSLMLTVGKYKGDILVTNTTEKYFSDNPQDLSKYGQVAGLMFPYDASGYSAKFDRVLRSKNMREGRDLDELITVVNNMKNTIASDWLDEQVAVGDLTADQAASMKDQLADKFGVQYVNPGKGGLTAEQKIDLLKKAYADPESNIRETPAGKSVETYLLMREQGLRNVQQAGLKTFRSDAAAPVRSYLYEQGEQLAAEDPAFKRVWLSLFRRELNEG